MATFLCCAVSVHITFLYLRQIFQFSCVLVLVTVACVVILSCHDYDLNLQAFVCFTLSSRSHYHIFLMKLLLLSYSPRKYTIWNSTHHDDHHSYY